MSRAYDALSSSAIEVPLVSAADPPAPLVGRPYAAARRNGLDVRAEISLELRIRQIDETHDVEALVLVEDEHRKRLSDVRRSRMQRPGWATPQALQVLDLEPGARMVEATAPTSYNSPSGNTYRFDEAAPREPAGNRQRYILSGPLTR